MSFKICQVDQWEEKPSLEILQKLTSFHFFSDQDETNSKKLGEVCVKINME